MGRFVCDCEDGTRFTVVFGPSLRTLFGWFCAFKWGQKNACKNDLRGWSSFGSVWMELISEEWQFSFVSIMFCRVPRIFFKIPLETNPHNHYDIRWTKYVNVCSNILFVLSFRFIFSHYPSNRGAIFNEVGPFLSQGLAPKIPSRGKFQKAFLETSMRYLEVQLFLSSLNALYITKMNQECNQSPICTQGFSYRACIPAFGISWKEEDWEKVRDLLKRCQLCL